MNFGNHCCGSRDKLRCLQLGLMDLSGQPQEEGHLGSLSSLLKCNSLAWAVKKSHCFNREDGCVCNLFLEILSIWHLELHVNAVFRVFPEVTFPQGEKAWGHGFLRAVLGRSLALGEEMKKRQKDTFCFLLRCSQALMCPTHTHLHAELLCSDADASEMCFESRLNKSLSPHPLWNTLSVT